MSLELELSRIENSKIDLYNWMEQKGYDLTGEERINDLIELLLPKKPTEGTFGIYVDLKNNIFTRLFDAEDVEPGEGFDGTVFGQIRRCTVSDSGMVIAYYGDEDFIEDGSNGQVMVEIPKLYYNVTPGLIEETSDGQPAMYSASYAISQTPQEGFSLHPAFINEDGVEADYVYIGAYEGCVYDDSTNTYDVNTSLSIDVVADKFSSILGVKPRINVSRSTCEQLAKNRGKGWHINGILEISLIQLLMLIEIGHFNMQSNFAFGVTSANASALTGATSDLGNTSGVALETNIDGTLYSDATKSSFSWRGIENPYGNVWEHIAGFTLIGDGAQRGGIPYICTDRYYAEPKGLTDMPSNYFALGYSVPANSNYISAFGYDENFDWVFIPMAVNGNSSIPVGDYFYSPGTLSGSRTILCGGYWGYVLSAGLFCWNLNRAVGASIATFGGRAVFIPTY